MCCSAKGSSWKFEYKPRVDLMNIVSICKQTLDTLNKFVRLDCLAMMVFWVIILSRRGLIPLCDSSIMCQFHCCWIRLSPPKLWICFKFSGLYFEEFRGRSLMFALGLPTSAWEWVKIYNFPSFLWIKIHRSINSSYFLGVGLIPLAWVAGPLDFGASLRRDPRIPCEFGQRWICRTRCRRTDVTVGIVKLNMCTTRRMMDL